MARPVHLFFYGTLMTGGANRQIAGIDPYVRLLGPGWITGRLYDLGEYPGVIPADTGRVHGELFVVHDVHDVHDVADADTVLAVLDAFEGVDPDNLSASLFLRHRVPVTLADGRIVEDVWVYFYNRGVTTATPIPSGRYRR